jgi:S1-C subfamily serine protease
VGDVVTRVADVLVFNGREMIDELSFYGPGESVTVSVKHSGFVRDVEVALGERPGESQRTYPQFGRVTIPSQSSPPAFAAPVVSPLADNTPPDRRLGLHTVAANPAALARRRLPDRPGALVVRIERDSPADLAGIPQSALIVAVDGAAIDSPATLEAAVGQAGASIELTYCIGDEERTARLQR